MPKITEKRSQIYAQNDVKSSLGGYLGANPFKLWDWKPKNRDWNLENGRRNPENGYWNVENGDWDSLSGGRPPSIQ